MPEHTVGQQLGPVFTVTSQIDQLHPRTRKTNVVSKKVS